MLRAGAATVEITPPAGLPMGGYGARQGTATGKHDALEARVLVLNDGATTLALVVCDMVGTPKAFATSIRELLQKDCGIAPEAICVSATHTHSGPGVLYSHRLDGWMAETALAIRDCVAEAVPKLEPAALKLGQASLTSVSQNRRDPDGPIEEVAQVLRVEGLSGAPICTVMSYACHATVLEHDNLLYSADFPGAARKIVGEVVGGVAIYLQGCCGDINPVWMNHGFDEVSRVGSIVGSAAAQVALEMAALGKGQWGVNLNWSEGTPKAAGGRLVAEATLCAMSESVSLSRRALPSLEELNAASMDIEDRLPDADEEQARRLKARRNRLEMERLVQSYPRMQVEESQDVEIQGFRLGEDLFLLALPGEFFVDTGSRIRAAARGSDVLLACYANEYIGYVPPAAAFPEDGYEVGFARYAEDSEEKVVNALGELVEKLKGLEVDERR